MLIAVALASLAAVALHFVETIGTRLGGILRSCCCPLPSTTFAQLLERSRPLVLHAAVAWKACCRPRTA
jgi:hypothetical protein